MVVVYTQALLVVGDAQHLQMLHSIPSHQNAAATKVMPASWKEQPPTQLSIPESCNSSRCTGTSSGVGIAALQCM